MDHLHHFGLAADPFRNEPNPAAYLETRLHAQALLRLERGARQAKGFTLLLGAAGSGKTMLLRQLFDRLEEEVFETSMLIVLSGAVDINWTLRRYAMQLGIEEPSADRETLYAEIYDQLAIVREDGRHAVLIIDDAEGLVATGALGELATLLKFEYEDRRLVSLILAGDASLEAALRDQPALADRVEIAVRLSGLDRDEAARYVAHRMALCSGDPGVIEPAALEALQKYAGGLPGRMNILADNALFEAYRAGHQRLTVADVECASAELLGFSEVASFAAAKKEISSEPSVLRSFVANGPLQDLRSVVSGSAGGLSAGKPLQAREEAYTELDAEFEAVFESATVVEAQPENRRLGTPAKPGSLHAVDGKSYRAVTKHETGAAPRIGGQPLDDGIPVREIPVDGPPKDTEAEVEDLLIEILDD